MSDIGEQSAFPCPRCGERRLAVIEFPQQRTMGYAPAFEIIGMGEPMVITPPAIGCLACGAEWPTVDDVRAELETAGAGAQLAEAPRNEAEPEP